MRWTSTRHRQGRSASVRIAWAVHRLELVVFGRVLPGDVGENFAAEIGDVFAHGEFAVDAWEIGKVPRPAAELAMLISHLRNLARGEVLP